MSEETNLRLVCRICRKPVSVGLDSAADEHGNTVHEACYISQVVLQSEDERLKDLFEQTAKEQDSVKLMELVQQINRILLAKDQFAKSAAPRPRSSKRNGCATGGQRPIS